MANFNPSKKTANDFNNNTQYLDYDPTKNQMGDGVQAATINNLVESQLWTQALATNTPDNTEANVVGVPSVEIVTATDGTPKLKFKNLKGVVGGKGDSGKDTLVYTQIDTYQDIEDVTDEPFSLAAANFNRTPTINETFLYVAEITSISQVYMFVCKITEILTGARTVKVQVLDMVMLRPDLSPYAKLDDANQTIHASSFNAENEIYGVNIIGDNYYVDVGEKLVLQTFGNSTYQTVSQDALTKKFAEYVTVGKASDKTTQTIYENKSFNGGIDTAGLNVYNRGGYYDNLPFIDFIGNDDMVTTLVSQNTSNEPTVYLPAADGTLALTSQIPSLSGYATEAYVDDEVSSMGTSIDNTLTNYAKKDDAHQIIKADEFIAGGQIRTPDILADSYYVSQNGKGLVLNTVDGSSTDQTVSQNAIKTALSGKANSSHSHAISDVTNLQNTLNGKASLGGTNVFTEFNDFQASVKVGSLTVGESGESGDTTNTISFSGNTTEDFVILQVDTADVHDIYRLTLPAKDGTLATTADITTAIGNINSLLDTINGEVI